MTNHSGKKLISHRATTGLKGHIKGDVVTMGDKSISHRALMFSALATGQSCITGLLKSEDTDRTRLAMMAMGVKVEEKNNEYFITSQGLLSLLPPGEPLNMGNSGTSARLLMGLLAGTGHEIKMIGDKSLSQRPMKRVIAPLTDMGVEITATNGNFLPLTMKGRPPLIPIDYSLPVASAQVKSAILLAGLSALGDTSVRENNISRDHTERMLQAFDLPLTIKETSEHRIATIHADMNLLENIKPQHIIVPRDISSVAFLLVAGSIVKDSHIIIDQVGLNPTRDGIIETLLTMGADIKYSYDTAQKGEPMGQVEVKTAELMAATTSPAIVPRMIDEYPILAVACATARGTSVLQGLAELRVKESDRLRAIAEGLTSAGVAVKTGDDWIEITGGDTIKGGATIQSHLDHRIAMAFYILGLISQEPITIDGGDAIATSFPDFLSLLAKLQDGTI